MAKIRAISGFPEWTPEQQLVENHVLDQVRRQFELHGFTPLETRAVEPLDVLLSKGETSQEVYVLKRLHAKGDEPAEFGLHFDLTVPFARYVAQNRGNLPLPLRRYQIQKVWRGERPALGRYREFIQADIDVIASENLAVEYDAEVLRTLHNVLASLPIPPVTLRVNNRKLLQGAYEALGFRELDEVLRLVDKLDKVGPDEVAKLLVKELGASEDQARSVLSIAKVRGTTPAALEAVRAMGLANATLDEGLEELSTLLENLADLPEGAVLCDLSIARGLNYYTGMVCEGQMRGYEDMGSVCSGGRYDNLASMGSNEKLPGVGLSIGVTRILGRLFSEKRLVASRATPTTVLVALDAPEARSAADAVAVALRARGIATEVFDRPLKYGKQIAYADKKGIPFVWFPTGADGAHAVRDIRTGEQTEVDPAAWEPPAEDRGVSVRLVDQV
ncbi:histidine--tRNA ligase [Engelhardtia mirabilis]|uniref:Histidine--tRNA ligase n=1 Tax=Engelhardtia mirabilis TaxID=2528011 RepID=A0A518BJP8_9BACT|nr:Histidine--tRNA ligase [Planctomycetes bacterium Pla133]QDV01538.1 Histidine--tRNA ligase [Planctomycetes bacterium Pla86]